MIPVSKQSCGVYHYSVSKKTTCRIPRFTARLLERWNPFSLVGCKRAQADSKNGYLLFLYGSPTCTDNEEYVDEKAFLSIAPATPLHQFVIAFKKAHKRQQFSIGLSTLWKNQIWQSNCQDIPKTLCRHFQNSAKNRNKKKPELCDPSCLRNCFRYYSMVQFSYGIQYILFFKYHRVTAIYSI